MAENFNCWHCGRVLENLILPMSRREECRHCGADQHVCQMCVFFDSKGRGDCQEERAELISARERANFCDYFKPSAQAFNANETNTQQRAKDKLMALFGEADGESAPPAPNTPTLSADTAPDANLSSADIARQKLRDLFGD